MGYTGGEVVGRTLILLREDGGRGREGGKEGGGVGEGWRGGGVWWENQYVTTVEEKAVGKENKGP